MTKKSNTVELVWMYRVPDPRYYREGCRKVALLIRKEAREGIREKWRIGGDMGLEKSKGRKVTISYNRAKGLDVDKPRNFAKSVTVE